jgi:hypothetical protein
MLIRESETKVNEETYYVTLPTDLGKIYCEKYSNSEEHEKWVGRNTGKELEKKMGDKDRGRHYE